MTVFRVFYPPHKINHYSTTMDQSYTAVEQRITGAMEALDQNEYDNATNAARAFKVDARRLQRRVAGGASFSERPATNTALTPAQELCICQY